MHSTFSREKFPKNPLKHLPLKGGLSNYPELEKILKITNPDCLYASLLRS